jgi:hypothetical protein
MTAPKSVRPPKGSDLIDWYERHAAEIGVSTNRALIIGLEHYRAATEGGDSTTAEGTTRHDYAEQTAG